MGLIILTLYVTPAQYGWQPKLDSLLATSHAPEILKTVHPEADRNT
jgi:hypothetical protein